MTPGCRPGSSKIPISATPSSSRRPTRQNWVLPGLSFRLCVADVEAFAQGIAAAGSLDPKKVRDALTKLDFESLYGRISFREKGQISLPETVIQIQNGNLVAVYGPKGFVEKPMYPMPPWTSVDGRLRRICHLAHRLTCNCFCKSSQTACCWEACTR